MVVHKINNILNSSSSLSSSIQFQSIQSIQSTNTNLNNKLLYLNHHHQTPPTSLRTSSIRSSDNHNYNQQQLFGHQLHSLNSIQYQNHHSIGYCNSPNDCMPLVSHNFEYIN